MPSAPDLKSDDYYKVLGVDRAASDNDIAKAYKKLALKHHPDKNQDNKEQAEENFKSITEAYEVLRDVEKRKMYDMGGKQGARMGPGGSSSGVSFQEADDLFRAFFGGNDPFSVFLDRDDDDMGNPFRGFHSGGPRVTFQRPSGGGMPGMGGMPPGMGGIFDMGGMGMPGMMPGFGGMKGAGKGKQRAVAPPLWAMPLGTTVTVKGLQKAQEHNGKVGKVKSFDQAKGRYDVELDGDVVLSLKPGNLTGHNRGRLMGIESQPQLNGQTGMIFQYDDEQGRYTIRLDVKLPNGRDVISVEPGKVVLEKGTRVTIQGLSKGEFNGLMGQIAELDMDASRYTVQCQSGKQIKIKFDNVLC